MKYIYICENADTDNSRASEGDDKLFWYQQDSDVDRKFKEEWTKKVTMPLFLLC